MTTETASSTFVVPFDEESPSLDIVGGKGLSLARMTGAGMAVPPGFIITTSAYRQSISQDDNQSSIIKRVHESGASAATDVQRLFDDVPIETDVID